MRVTWRACSPSILATLILACGGEAYRIGGNNDGPPADGGAAGVSGQGGTSGGSAGTGGQPTSFPDGGLEPPTGPPLTTDFEWIASSELGVLFLATDEQNLYFNELAGPVWRADHAGTAVEKLAETESYHMATDATHVYWTTTTDIRRVPKTGGAVEVVVTSGSSMRFWWPALDDASVYATTDDAGMVVRAPKTGGPPRVIANTSTRLGGSAVDQGSLYWNEYDRTGSIFRLDLATLVSEPFFQAGAAVALRVAGDSIWFGCDQDPNSWQKRLVRVPFGGEAAVAYSVPGHLIPYDSDGLHMYWAFTDVVRIDLATGKQELVADEVAPANKASHLAFTRDWIFIATRASPGGIIRLPKPAP